MLFSVGIVTISLARVAAVAPDIIKDDTQTLEINMTGGAASRITARVRKDEATGWIFAEATIQAIDGE
ncbi:hypothetical protein ACSLOE_30985, partial [Escherichia coli]|uniref:hypothetical protein n=1 Tax=Escherichia coli TaxID=562 RepID=UPI003EDECEE0